MHLGSEPLIIPDPAGSWSPVAGLQVVPPTSGFNSCLLYLSKSCGLTGLSRTALLWVFACVTGRGGLGLGLRSHVHLGWNLTCLIHMTGGGCWLLLAGSSAGAVDGSTCGLGSSKHGGWVPRGCFPRVNVPGVPAGASYNPSSELPEHHSHHILLVRQVTKPSPGSAGRRPHPALRGNV